MITQKICDKLGLVNDIDYTVNKTNTSIIIGTMVLFLISVRMMV